VSSKRSSEKLGKAILDYLYSMVPGSAYLTFSKGIYFYESLILPNDVRLAGFHILEERAATVEYTTLVSTRV